MGYRERRAHKAQQKQQSLGQGYSKETIVNLVAPTGENHRDNIWNFAPQDAQLLYNFLPKPGGLAVGENSERICVVKQSLGPVNIITYESSGTASAEMWCIAKPTAGGGALIYNASDLLVFSASVTASGSAAPSTCSISTSAIFDYTELNKNIIATNGVNNLTWNRANGWEAWQATASGDNIDTMWGVLGYKTRIYAWQKDSPKFWYCSADQINGTFNPYDLSTIIPGNIITAIPINMSIDTGPSQFIGFVSDLGHMAVYQGVDPSDATDFSLVGTYKIGQPMGRKSWAQYGNTTVLLCEDDFYFFPEDMQGKRRSTKGAKTRYVESDYNNGEVTAVHWRKHNLLVFSDGTCLDPKNNFSITSLQLTSADPFQYRVAGTQSYPKVATHKNALFSMGERSDGGSLNLTIGLYQPYQRTIPSARNGTARLVTGPIPTSGRTNITMVAPKFSKALKNTDASASGSFNPSGIKYRVGAVYDDSFGNADNITKWPHANNIVWVTSSIEAVNQTHWTPLPGTGTDAVIVLEILSASVGTSASEIIYNGMDIAISDSGEM